MENKIRNLIFKLYKHLVNLERLFERMEWHEIGFTGHITNADKNIANEKEYKPLNKFEKWLLNPIIKSEKERRQFLFASSISECLGEGINDWL